MIYYKIYNIAKTYNIILQTYNIAKINLPRMQNQYETKRTGFHQMDIFLGKYQSYMPIND